MKSRLINLLKHPLISGSSVVFIGSFISNVINYFFNLAMGRILTVSEYGILLSLTSIITIFAILQISLGNIFTKFTAQFFAQNNRDGINTVFLKGLKISLVLGAIILGILVLLLPFLLSFLKLDDPLLLIIVFISIFISIATSLPMGMLQGEMKFYLISFLGITSALIKTVLGVGLVFLGYKVFGALIAVFIAFLVPYLLSFLYVLKGYKSSKKNIFDESKFVKEFKNYSVGFFIATVSIALIQNGDIILVRNLFDPIVAGQYAALSLMGKAIFYLTAPLYFVFFPLIAYKKEKKEAVFKTLVLAMGIIVLFGSSLSFLYFTFPNLILALFFPAKEYLVLASLLGPFSLYVLVFSLAFLMSNYLLSIGKTGIFKLNLIAVIIMTISFFIFHESLFQVILILFSTSFLLLLSLLLYYIKNGRD
ncbi:MAG: hypothetical protein COU27_02965 [Candidatus Levybacteria bacterium CG10_big_fil_rev_8_21_14_0_10_36_7]|nr:MAG: hypothetical protein COU27_02965 [Candidatus Levybacteria bacterium CG10_big_fil_rev_8_21_14_0_10_36_7]